MNTSELIKILSERLNKPQSEIKSTFNSVIAVLKEKLVKHNSFRIPSFGTFDIAERKHRKSYNPHFKKMMLVPQKIVGVFRPAKALRENINKAE